MALRTAPSPPPPESHAGPTTSAPAHRRSPGMPLPPRQPRESGDDAPRPPNPVPHAVRSTPQIRSAPPCSQPKRSTASPPSAETAPPPGHAHRQNGRYPNPDPAHSTRAPSARARSCTPAPTSRRCRAPDRSSAAGCPTSTRSRYAALRDWPSSPGTSTDSSTSPRRSPHQESSRRPTWPPRPTPASRPRPASPDLPQRRAAAPQTNPPSPVRRESQRPRPAPPHY